MHNTNPPLEESRLALLEGLITPNPLHFIRNHSASPAIDVAAWRLTVDGEVDKPLNLTYDDIRTLPSKSIDLTIECAGNSRSRYSPPATGTPWGNGAVSTAEWTGVSLSAVMTMAGIRPSTVHVIARGGDSAAVTRGLPTEWAMRPETMLAWAMNGELLPVDHGFPLRLVVPNWLGVASVKWATQLTASPTPNRGQQQGVNYIFDWPGRAEKPEMTLLAVKSVIARPEAGAVVGGGPLLISGFAWSGAGRIAGVEVSADDGQSWAPARILEPVSALHWARWDLPWQPPAEGAYTLLSRAADETGAVQPDSVEWNRLGYVYNAIQGVPITVAGAVSAPAAAPVDSPEPVPEAPAPGEEVVAAAPTGGAAVYGVRCASCHGPDGQGGTKGPLVIGDGSVVRAVSREQLYDYVSTNMPFREPGSLSPAEYEQVVEFLRQANGLQ